MEFLLGLSGVLASLLGLVLAFYAVFVNGRMTREILWEIHKSAERQIQMMERQALSLERIEETTRYVAELVIAEGEKTRTEIRQLGS